MKLGAVHHDGEWGDSLMNMEIPAHDSRWDPPLDVKPPKKKRASKKDKGEKADKAASVKKRGRKPKTDKLGSAGKLADTGGVPFEGAILDWAGFTGPNSAEGGASEEANATRARVSVLQSVHEGGIKPSLTAFSDEVRCRVVWGCLNRYAMYSDL